MNFELERERAVQALCSHYAQDHLTTQELEVRFEQAYRASTVDELGALLRNLPTLVPVPAGTTPLPMYAVAPPRAAAPEKRFLSIMADVRRQGQWNVPSRVRARAYLGVIKLDLREAQIPEGGLDVDVFAFMGEVKILLPPGLHADVDGFALMGEFSDRTTSAAGSLATIAVRVHGTSFMSAVRVETRLPREGALEAWKRRLLGS